MPTYQYTYRNLYGFTNNQMDSYTNVLPIICLSHFRDMQSAAECGWTRATSCGIHSCSTTHDQQVNGLDLLPNLPQPRESGETIATELTVEG